MLWKKLGAICVTAALTLGACISPTDHITSTQTSAAKTKASGSEAAYLRNVTGALHNETMARVFLRLNGRRSLNRGAICKALFDVLSTAPEIKSVAVRQRLIASVFEPPEKVAKSSMELASLKRFSLSDECGASLTVQLSAAFSSTAATTSFDEEVCYESCGSGGTDPSEPTYAISNTAFSRAEQIVEAAKTATSLSQLESQLSTLTTSGVTAFNAVEMEMLESHASLAHASYLDAEVSAESFSGSCTDYQKRAKMNNIGHEDAKGFIGVVAAASAGPILSVATKLVWSEVFVGAAIAAGALSAYQAVVEVTTPCN